MATSKMQCSEAGRRRGEHEEGPRSASLLLHFDAASCQSIAVAVSCDRENAKVVVETERDREKCTERERARE